VPGVVGLISLGVITAICVAGIGLMRKREAKTPRDLRRADDAQRQGRDQGTARDAAFGAIDMFHPLP